MKILNLLLSILKLVNRALRIWTDQVCMHRGLQIICIFDNYNKNYLLLPY